MGLARRAAPGRAVQCPLAWALQPAPRTAPRPALHLPPQSAPRTVRQSSRRSALMFRVLLLLTGVAIAVLVALYFLSGQVRYLSWARRLFVAGLGLGVVFFVVLTIKRLI
jgi:hypothetical protein